MMQHIVFVFQVSNILSVWTGALHSHRTGWSFYFGCICVSTSQQQSFITGFFFFYCTIVFGSVSSVFHHRCLFVILKRLHVNSVSSFKCLVQPIYTSGQDTVVVLQVEGFRNQQLVVFDFEQCVGTFFHESQNGRN